MVNSSRKIFTNFYSSAVKVNNWFEDRITDEQKLREFIDSKLSQQLHSSDYKSHVAHLTDPLTTSKSPSETAVRFGDIIQLKNVTKSVQVSSDYYSKSFIPNNKLGATENADGESVFLASGEEKQDIVKTCFVVARAPGDKNPSDLVTYGRKIRLLTAQQVFGSDFQIALKCVPKSIANFPILGNGTFPQVTLGSGDTYDAIWEFTEPEHISAKRTAAEKLATIEYERVVTKGDEIVLKHTKSNQVMFCFDVKQRTFFGDAFPILCGYNSAGVKLNNSSWTVL